MLELGQIGNMDKVPVTFNVPFKNNPKFPNKMEVDGLYVREFYAPSNMTD